MRIKASIVLIGALCAAALSATAACEEGHWGYEGGGGPAYWGSLSPAFSACADGTEQSPIDLAGAETRDLVNIEFDYAPGPIAIINNGHTIQVNYAPGSAITLDGARYELIQFHFHHGSEHTVAGVRFPMELHLVHRADKGALAVIGILLKEGVANEALAPVWRHLPTEQTSATVVPGMVDAAALLPGRRTTWRYRGSLTTPPCTEGVKWLVMTEPAALAAEQIASYRAIFAHSHRPVQPLNQRTLVRDARAR